MSSGSLPVAYVEFLAIHYWVPLYQGSGSCNFSFYRLTFSLNVQISTGIFFSEVLEWSLIQFKGVHGTMTLFKNLCFNLKICLWLYAYMVKLEESRIFYMVTIVFRLLKGYSFLGILLVLTVTGIILEGWIF